MISTNAYLKFMGTPYESLTPEQREQMDEAQRVMLSRNVVNSLAYKLHHIKPGLAPEALKSHIHDVIDILRKPGKEGSIPKISEYFLAKGFVKKKEDGSIERLFRLDPGLEHVSVKVLDKGSGKVVDQYSGRFGALQAVGTMTSFFSVHPECQDLLVDEAVRRLKSKNVK